MNNEDRISNEQCTMNNVQWRKVKFGDCCESELGKTLDEGRNTGLYRPYLCALNVLWGKIDLSTIKKMRIEDSELERYLVKKGDLLVCEGGEIGRCAIWEYDDVIYYQNALHRVRFYEGYDARFFMYLLCHYNDLKLIEQYGKGLTIKHLNQTAFRNIPVSIPSLPVQRRIAAILSSADKVIASTQKVIDKLKQIKQGMMDDLLKPKDGWRMVKLGECCEDIFSGRNTKRNDFGKYIVFGSTGIIGYSETYEYDFDSVLVARVGANAGLVNIARGLYDVSDNTLIIKFGKNIFLDYLYYLLIQMNLNQYIFGSGQPLVTAGLLKNLDIFIPSLSEQRRISTILSGIDSKIAAEEKVLGKYKAVKKGLMEKLLNGK